jgi:hypothetical protein
LTRIDDDGMQAQWLNGIEIPGIQSRIRIESFSFEQQTMKQKSNQEQIKSSKEQNK